MRFLITAFIFLYCSHAAYAARIVNMDNQPRQFKVSSGNQTKTVTLQPKQSYFTGPENATVTTQEGNTIELNRYQKSVIHEGQPLLWRGHKTPGNDRPEGYQ